MTRGHPAIRAFGKTDRAPPRVRGGYPARALSLVVGLFVFACGIVRGSLELSVLLVGIVLGGTFGVGTVAFVLLIGAIIEVSFALLARSPLAAPGEPPEVIEAQ